MQESDQKLKSIIEKIQALLSLAESDNEHEAFQAATKARKLLERYNLEEQQVRSHRSGSSNDIVIVEIDYITRDIKSWELRLLAAIAYPFYCATTFNKDDMNLVGTVVDTRVARDVFVRVRSHLISISYQRMADYGKAVKQTARELFGRDHVDLRKTKGEFRPHQFRIGWLEGTIQGITSQITRQRKLDVVDYIGSYQLVVNRMKRIDIFLESQGIPKVNLGDTSTNSVGLDWGRKDGRNTSLHRADIARKDSTLMLESGE